jgi:hypothetical protein
MGLTALKGSIIVNNELGRMWKEAFMTCFNILSQNLFRGTEEDH